MQTDSRSRGQSESYSQNTQRLGRELMTPAELATMPGDKCISQLRGLPPFFSPKYDLKRHPNYRYTAEALSLIHILAARDRPVDHPETGGQHRHEGHAGGTESRGTVSYTHLDVYKRQAYAYAGIYLRRNNSPVH